MSNYSNFYQIGFTITAFIAFVCCWIYAIATYGFFIGVALGWIPSLIAAAVIGAIWPVIALGLIIVMLKG